MGLSTNVWALKWVDVFAPEASGIYVYDPSSSRNPLFPRSSPSFLQWPRQRCLYSLHPVFLPAPGVSEGENDPEAEGRCEPEARRASHGEEHRL